MDTFSYPCVCVVVPSSDGHEVEGSLSVLVALLEKSPAPLGAQEGLENGDLSPEDGQVDHVAT